MTNKNVMFKAIAKYESKIKKVYLDCYQTESFEITYISRYTDTEFRNAGIYMLSK